MMTEILDHGYVRFVEAWGHGDAGNGRKADATEGPDKADDMECGIVEAARQSTQASFRGWEDVKCERCGGKGVLTDYGIDPYESECGPCQGKGYLPGDHRLLKFLFTSKPAHAGPFEFAGAVIEVQAPIFVFREWHRHRTQSYNEMSARYAPLPDLNYIPTVERLLLDGGRNKQAQGVQGAAPLTRQGAEWFRTALAEKYAADEEFYQEALKAGVPKELARIKLPVGRYSRMRACANLRNWLAFMTLRADPAAQWEIRQYALEVGRILERQFPRTWALFANS